MAFLRVLAWQECFTGVREWQRHDQSACPSLEIRWRRRSAGALGVGVLQQGLRRGFGVEIPPAANDPRGEAPPGTAVGSASV